MSKESRLITDSHGILTGVEYHDGILCHMDVDLEHKTIGVVINSSSGAKTKISLSGIKMLRISNFLDGNIVSYIHVDDIDHFSRKFIDRTVNAWRAIFQETLTEDNLVLEVVRVCNRYVGCKLVSLETSCGCSITAIARNVDAY
ncbi:hypothetical protein [Frigidibacter sp. SD6-1]|uniref:hypothetical protein n=1 Tax=Frigidibacter sp. SD6-1 TaxID=3032581 RepID=UPI0024E040D1|nr:hypothetical protein [Frigidibacter sp. SD6-1]